MFFGNANKNLRINYIVNVLDGAFFGFGISFASFATVLPLFFSTLTTSNLLIGLIPAVHNTGIMLPQLFTAGSISRVRRFLPTTMKATIHERLPFIGLALTAFLVPYIGKDLALIFGFACLVWQGLGAGFTGNPWQNLLGRVIPSEYLATFFGVQASASNLLGSFGAATAGFILEKLDSPGDFILNFIICFLLLMVSYFSLGMTREEERTLEETPKATVSLGKNILTILKKDRPFLWYLITRNIYQFGTMAFAFYSIYAVKHHGMSEATAGIMTSVLFISQTIANPLLGWLADHWNRRHVLTCGALAASISAILAWQVSDPGLYFLVFVLMSVGNVAFWTIGMAYTLDFGTEEERPTYVGMANTLIAPSAILAPLAGGWIADTFGYSVTFIVAAICGLVTMLVLQIFVKEHRKPTAN